MDRSFFSRILYYAPYLVPFILFAAFTYAGPLLGAPRGIIYPLKTMLVAGSLAWFWNAFREEIQFYFSWSAVLWGTGVFLVWIVIDKLYPHIGHSAFNPHQEALWCSPYVLIAFRMIGAASVVPLMEEVFWRSFALRFVIKADFRSVPLGHFSWYSFLLISILFGLEHHRWLAGIFAGMVYAGLLCRSRNLFTPILSHGVTNLLLGIYVLWTESWSFW